MHLLIAPDKFKGSLSASQVCEVVKEGVLEQVPEAKITFCPLADGGEGTLDILKFVLSLDSVNVEVQDPLFRPIKAEYGRKGDKAYIEMALASGLPLLDQHERSAALTSSIGTGQLIKHALENGSTEINLFIGGSACNDGGVGIASALGYQFLDESGTQVQPRGASLASINQIKSAHFDLSDIEFNLFTDVQNMLLGPDGAASQYGPQKGLQAGDLELLEHGMEKFCSLVEGVSGVQVSTMKGSGAAGGVAVCLVGLLGGKIMPGISAVMEIVEFSEKVLVSDLVITGEGKMDVQTLQGKVVKGVSDQCKQHNKPVYAVCGISTLSLEEQESLGIDRLVQLKRSDLTSEYCMANAAKLLKEEVQRLFH